MCLQQHEMKIGRILPDRYEVVWRIRTGDDQYIAEGHHEEDLLRTQCCLQDEGVLEALKEREPLSDLA